MGSIVKTIGGGGIGTKNYVGSPNSITNWSVSGAMTIANEIVAANLPDASVGSGIKFLSSATGYAYYRFTLDAADYSKKLLLQLDQKYAGSAGDYTVSVYSNTASAYNGTSTQLTLQTSSIPAVTGTFTTTFDAPGASAPYIEVRVNYAAGSGTALWVNNFLVGPGTIVQGAAVSEWIPYTDTVTNGGTATFTYLVRQYRRVGSSMEITYQFSVSGAGSGASSVTIPLPAGFTINTAALASSDSMLGTAWRYVSVGTTGTALYARNVSGTTNGFIIGNTVGGAVAGSNLALNDSYYARVIVPIAEWAGSGTVNLGPGAQVEYAFNTSTSTSASDTTSFGYGPQGAQIQNITTALTRRVRFQYPIQVDDLIEVQVSEDRIKWITLDQSFWATNGGAITQWTRQNNVDYGIGRIIPIASNVIDLDIGFGTYSIANGTTFASAGQPWASGGGACYYRVRKVKASSPVGFGLVSLANGAGLMPSLTSQLDDSTATKLGLKQYLHGTTYSGGNAPTVTCAQAGFVVTRAVFVPYQMQDGTWRLRFNFAATFTSASISTINVNINGILSKNVTGFSQAIISMFQGNNTIGRAFVGENSNTCRADLVSAITCAGLNFSGDVELDSKPTWAY
jgi:hypothetical protein